MNKAFKVIGKAVKWYLIADVVVWTCIGVADGLNECVENPNNSITNGMANVWDRAIEKYKNWFRYVKGE